MKEVKTAIYCYLHRCSSLLLWSASLCLPSSPPAHDERAIESETDTLGCFSGCTPAAVTQQLLQKFIWLDEGQTVKQYGGYRHRSAPPPPSLRSCPWPHSSLCSQPTLGSGLNNADPMRTGSVVFLDFCSASMGPLCRMRIRCISHICKYLWVCFTHKRTLQLTLFYLSLDVSIRQRKKIPPSKKPTLHSFGARLCLSLSQVF